MDYEEKYKQAMFRMNKWAEGSEITDPKEVAEFVFPELKESEEELMRKETISIIRQYSIICEREGDKCYTVDKVIAWLEKQVEQKLTDKVEPKFKVGDWIVTPNNETKQIEKVTFGNYYFADKTIYNIIDTDNNGHLWTIEDAKDGDVLCYRNDVFLVKHYVLFNKVVSHCTYGERFIPHNTYSFTRADFSKIYPATKEQRDLLFRKMKEAGYEWDAEKKELKKIENKPTWSEEDEKEISKLIKFFMWEDTGYRFTIEDCLEATNWLKSLKERMKGE